MVAAEHHRDLDGARPAGELIRALRVAGHGADTHQIGAAEVGGHLVDGFVDQHHLGIQLRRDERRQRSERGWGIGSLGPCLVPAPPVVEPEHIGVDQQNSHSRRLIVRSDS